ncbi:MAG: NAD(P)H-hydrate dehydratase [Dethiobacteria bacterium]|jgi:NAD(P)H-hydrate repair Nnr-like enzyme with NAD(P)H-hydrate dehydratase domain
MLGIVGTIPEENFPLVTGKVSLEGNQIILGDERIAVNRGTPAMIAAAAETLKYMHKPNPYCFLVGDIGNGEGCKRLYKHLASHIAELPLKTLTLHYFQPDVGLFKQLLSAIDAMPARPTLIADAGFMYVAKMGGDASFFDLFTPDAGELAYLADEKAPHPFYTRGFILHDENMVPDLINRAYQHNNAATYLLVKGATDYIANRSGVLATVDSPQEEALEAIGGTGDTLTGIVSALIHSGLDLESASVKAAKINRLAGSLARPTPATQVYDIIRQIPHVLEGVLTK